MTKTRNALWLGTALRVVGLAASATLALAAARFPWRVSVPEGQGLVSISGAMVMVFVALAVTSMVLFSLSRSNRAAAVGAALMGAVDVFAALAVLHAESIPISVHGFFRQSSGVVTSLCAGILICSCGLGLTAILYRKRGTRMRAVGTVR